MEGIERSIEVAKSFIFDRKCVDPRCSRVWYGATESIKDYFELLEWSDAKKVLTVCSSGDHILNLVNRGIKEIDSFDTNPLTFPYFNLRLAFMLTFSYEEFFRKFDRLSIASSSERKEYELFLAVKDFIPEPYNYFWEELYSENLVRNKHDIMTPSLLGNLCMHYIPSQTSKLRNKWLSDKEEYERTRQNLEGCNISFNCCDVFDLPNVFSSNYDKILLSNISDYLGVDNKKFHRFISDDLASMLNENGEVLAAYVYHYIDDGDFSGVHFKKNVDGDYSVFEEDYQLFQVRNIHDYGTVEYGSKDGILVYQKK